MGMGMMCGWDELLCCRRLLILCLDGDGAAVDIYTVCPARSHSIIGTSQCSPCAPGTFNPVVDQSACSCCGPGFVANVSGLSQCLSCAEPGACIQPCSAIPNCNCVEPEKCDKNRCPVGCYTTNGSSVSQPAPAGSFASCGGSNCSAASNVLDICPRGTSSSSVGADSNSTWKAWSHASLMIPLRLCR